MKILQRYVLGSFLRTFFGILLVLSVLLLMKEILSEMDQILNRNPPISQVVLYFVYIMPESIVFVIPTTAILSMMFSVGTMAKNKEILAIHACGVSYVRLALPLIAAIFVITVSVYLTNEVLVPVCLERANRIEEVVFKGRDESILTRNRNVTTKGAGNRFYTMSNYDSSTNEMERPTITEYQWATGTIVMRLDAERAVLVEQTEKGWESVVEPVKDRKYHWLFKNAARREFQGNNLVSFEQSPEMVIAMEENLDQFLNTNKKPKRMTLAELYKHAEVEAQRHPDGDFYKKLTTQFQNRLSMPLATLLLGLLGYTFAVRASIRSLVLEFGFALVGIVFYYSLLSIAGKMGENQVVSPLVAAWSTNILFLVVLLWRFRQLERVPKL